jgi:hypothetical protein
VGNSECARPADDHVLVAFAPRGIADIVQADVDGRAQRHLVAGRLVGRKLVLLGDVVDALRPGAELGLAAFTAAAHSGRLA